MNSPLTSRPTISHGHQIAATRTLTTTVTYPSSGGPFPLIVFAHGYQLGPANYGQIMRAIAAGGYVVAAPSFPLADAAVAEPEYGRPAEAQARWEARHGRPLSHPSGSGS